MKAFSDRSKSEHCERAQPQTAPFFLPDAKLAPTNPGRHHVKITIDLDMTPEEARQFLGLPNVEKLQEQWLTNAQEYLRDNNQAQVADFINSAMQPMFAYQNWVQRMLMGGENGKDKPSTSGSKSTKAPENAGKKDSST